MRKMDTYSTKRIARQWVIAAVLFVLAVACGIAIFISTNVSLTAEGAQSIRQTILDSAKQCYAIEGAYPASLDYLCDAYGLSVNTDGFIITYEVFASNVMPEVTVTVR